MLSSDIYKNLIGIAVDEADCISHWWVLFLLLKRPFWSVLIYLPCRLFSLLSFLLFSFFSFSWIHHCIHLFKKLFSNIFNAQFYMSSASSVTSNFWQLLYHFKWCCTFPGFSVSASDFCYCTMVNMIVKRKHYNFISYHCTITCIYKKDTNLYIITVLSYFLRWSKKGHKQEWWTLNLHILIKTWHFVFIKLCEFNLFITAACVSCWSNYDVPKTK